MPPIGHEAEVEAVRRIVLAADKRVREEVKWNAPSFYINDHFATFRLGAKEGLQLILHLGVKPRKDAKVRESVADPEGLLSWKSPDRAVITFRDLAQIRRVEGALATILKGWIPHVT